MLTSAPAATSIAGIEVRSLTRTFLGQAGPVHAVRGIDFSISSGETVALLGPNGAGKSTTIDMLLGLARPDGGSVSLFGRTPADAVEHGAVGAMLQTGGLVHDVTVHELLHLMGTLYPNPLGVAETIELASIEHLAARRTQQLSGGELQRVRCAVALIGNPDVLILDEPTVAMDVTARREFWSTMRAFAERGKTIVFATHYLEEADAWADRIILMAHGRIVADGSATEITSIVGGRVIRATLPDVDGNELAGLPGVTSVERHGSSVSLTCRDSDTALRALLDRFDGVCDIEIRGAGLEAAFLELTSDGASNEGGAA